MQCAMPMRLLAIHLECATPWEAAVQVPAILFSIACLVFSSTFIRSSCLENATLVDEQPTAPGFYRCFYQTMGVTVFSIIVSGPCPLSVMVNPEDWPSSARLGRNRLARCRGRASLTGGWLRWCSSRPRPFASSANTRGVVFSGGRLQGTLIRHLVAQPVIEYTKRICLQGAGTLPLTHEN